MSIVIFTADLKTSSVSESAGWWWRPAVLAEAG
jgi:hypothetical protein